MHVPCGTRHGTRKGRTSRYSCTRSQKQEGDTSPTVQRPCPIPETCRRGQTHGPNTQRRDHLAVLQGVALKSLVGVQCALRSGAFDVGPDAPRLAHPPVRHHSTTRMSQPRPPPAASASSQARRGRRFAREQGGDGCGYESAQRGHCSRAVAHHTHHRRLAHATLARRCTHLC